MLTQRNQHGRTTRRQKRVRKAYTFIEVLIVVLILGIVAAVAVPRTAGAITRLQATAAAKRVAADLSLARRKATTGGKPQSVQFDVAGNRYTLPGVSHLDRPTANYEVELAATGYAATLVQADFAGGQTVTFDLYGRPSSGGEVVVRSGNIQKTIYLDADTGQASAP